MTRIVATGGPDDLRTAVIYAQKVGREATACAFDAVSMYLAISVFVAALALLPVRSGPTKKEVPLHV